MEPTNHSLKKKRICHEIEQVRGQMIVLGINYGFLHPDVQQCSKHLDELLLQFYAMDQAADVI